jgi:2-keto-4-pentenoate hydratase/2-oxohepta-3-ene-1,7-dioic acid hydratase in catechol pathway
MASQLQTSPQKQPVSDMASQLQTSSQKQPNWDMASRPAADLAIKAATIYRSESVCTGRNKVDHAIARNKSFYA